MRVCVCLSAFAEKLRTYEVAFANDAKRAPPTPPPWRWPTLNTLCTLTLSSFGAASVTCCSARPASSSALSVLPEDRNRRTIRHAACFCESINIFHIFHQTFIVLKLGWRSTTGSPELLSSSPVAVSPPDATAKPMATFCHFNSPCRV